MPSKGIFQGWEFDAFIFTGDNTTNPGTEEGAAAINPAANGPLPEGNTTDADGNTLPDTVIGVTMTVEDTASWYTIEIDDDAADNLLEDQFVEGETQSGSGATRVRTPETDEDQTVIGSGTNIPGVADGDQIEIEYALVLSGDDGSTVTIYSLVTESGGENTGDATVWLSNGEINPNVTYTITDSFDGPQIPYSSLFDEICFTSGTLIDTPTGPQSVDTLSIGDLVMTKDHGAQPIRWISARTRFAAKHIAPVIISAGTLGNERDLAVSPQHRILVSGWRAELFFGVTEILVPAKALVNGDTIYQAEAGQVTYVHFMCDRHEIVVANGVPTETFHAGAQALATLDTAARNEIFEIFPELRENGNALGSVARPIVRVQDAATLTAR
ncbi:MAG: Hint domain-containing protein [Pseudomonadota bacterium]